MDYGQVIFSVCYAHFYNTYNDGSDHALLLASFCVAQAKHETANFTSAVFTDDNNICGYTYVGQSLASASKHYDGRTPYAHYKSVNDSALELAQWIGRRFYQFKSIATLYDYCSVLKSDGYFGDTLNNYYNGCNAFYISPDGFSRLSPLLVNTNLGKLAIPLVAGGVVLYLLLS